jgi:ectoine hydroxylase-related dioxygenase (phytanoyl-CoA dioxygenase family)
MVHDKIFLEIINSYRFQKILKKLFKDSASYYILNQQNIIINKPENSHNQSSWHRDFPYFSSYMPFGSAFSIIITLSNFNFNNGGTKVLPYSHKMKTLPRWDFINSENVTINCKIGSLIIFDSQLYHCAG